MGKNIDEYTVHFHSQSRNLYLYCTPSGFDRLRELIADEVLLKSDPQAKLEDVTQINIFMAPPIVQWSQRHDRLALIGCAITCWGFLMLLGIATTQIASWFQG